jgi:hypothetical protein
MQDRGNEAAAATANRTIIELSIVAAIVVVIVSIMSSVNCRTPYLGSLCAALTVK